MLCSGPNLPPPGRFAVPTGFDKLPFVLAFSRAQAEVPVGTGVKRTHLIFTFREPADTFKNPISALVAKKERGACVSAHGNRRNASPRNSVFFVTAPIVEGWNGPSG